MGRNRRMGVKSEVRFAIVPEWLIFAPVSAQAIRLYAVLGRYADREHKAHPSRPTLAKKMHTSVKTVDRALEELTNVNAVEITRRPVEGKSEWDTNEYTLRVSQGVGTPVSPPSDTDDATGSDTGVQGVGTQVSPEREPVNENQLNESFADAPLCELLVDLMVKNGSRRKHVPEAWRTAERLLLERDMVPYAEAERVLRWCQADTFWRGVILSMTNFRDKYDQLLQQSHRQNGKGHTEGLVPRSTPSGRLAL